MQITFKKGEFGAVRIEDKRRSKEETDQRKELSKRRIPNVEDVNYYLKNKSKKDNKWIVLYLKFQKM